MTQQSTLPLPATAASGETSRPIGDPPRAAVGAGADRYLTFLLGGQPYALPILDVVEILAYRPLTTVPMMPDHIRGVLNLRGSVVPVLDLAIRFRGAPTDIARRTSIVIVDPGSRRGAERRMGILVDAVNKVLHLTQDQIEPPPHLGDEHRVEIISAMARHGDQFIVVLDLDNLTALDEFKSLDTVLDQAALNRAALDRAAPDQATPDQAALDQAPSDQAPSDPGAS